MNVIMNRLSYSAPVWTKKALSASCNRASLTRAHRLAGLRVVRAYRTDSDDTALFLADTMPVHITALEKAHVYTEV